MRKIEKNKKTQLPLQKDCTIANNALSLRLLKLLGAEDYTPLDYPGLVAALPISKEEESYLQASLAELLERGHITLIKHKRYCLPKDADLIVGHIRFRPSGSATLIAEESSEKVYTFTAEDTGLALHDDRVVIRIKSLSRRERPHLTKDQIPAEVVRVIKRAREQFNGTLQVRRKVYFVIPDDPKITQDILLASPTTADESRTAVVGDKVVVKLLSWENRHLNPLGEIIEVIGVSHTAEAEFQGLLRKYDLSLSFPEAVEQEVQKIPSKIPSLALENRLDCRNLLTLTIDPVDSKDFDDALSWEESSDGSWKVGIHIADVAYYVQPEGPLDKEAKRRGNSTYLIGAVIPMLPHALSSGLCSLIEGEDRLTKSVFLQFTPKGKLLDVQFANTVIRSTKRLSYPQALAFLQGKSLKDLKNLPAIPAHQTGYTGRCLSDLNDSAILQIQTSLKNLWALAQSLRKKRMQQGSLDLDMPEVKIYLDPQGYADRIEKITHDESHQLVEEFMLLANECVAKAYFEQGLAFLSRVHDAPDFEKLDEYRDFLSLFHIYVGDLSLRKEVGRLLAMIKEHPQGQSLRLQFLKSLKQACYRPKNDGHYGLNKTFYTHFTSPIRRYADLSIHRLWNTYLQKAGLPTFQKDQVSFNLPMASLHVLGEQLSQTERISTEAERESKRIKLLEFFEKEAQKPVQQSFEATIVDIKNIGLFIELNDSLAFGLVHVSSLEDDFYHLNAEGTALIGRRFRKRYLLGDEIQVCIAKVDRFKRQIDFVLAPEYNTMSQQAYNKVKKTKKQTKRIKKQKKITE